MKKMNIISMLMMLLIASSCSTDSVLEKYELNQSQVNSKFTSELSYTEVHLHQYFLETELDKLYELKNELMLEIEEGNKKKLPELEDVLQQIKENESYHKYNAEFLGIVGPILPPAPKPRPCNDPGEDLNCPVRIESFTNFWFSEIGEIQEVKVFDSKGQTLSRVKSIAPAKENDAFTIHSLEIKKGEKLTIEITKYFKLTNQPITYTLDAYSN